ncbi:hypothetical protein N5J77_01075 [Sphingobium yanoikuyae]|uniref:Uncharacterized protein n=1 Tax=Sphingobium yanoikuyae TaxID=13690 RepID=A0AA42WQD1_SPHYA|nr:hypothetical protein [Sphingobium yanoikuyae]MDH2129700.1 hypothetical protein [Sphingobium yanoikuyae]MDH2152824.1 hypothetical protein [Sphingobium yanoikuyae]MDH2165381.1 hypothetical protein [Sphingobium yanoikuyae]
MMMVDLFPPPQDRNAGHDSARSAPRHDPVPQHGEDADGPRIWPFPHHLAEAGVQFLSRWAGPVALVGALLLIGWWLFR